MRLRIGAAMTGMAGCAVACALLWPHARDAGAILAAQDDPAELSDIRTQFCPAEYARHRRAKYRSGAGGR